MLCAIATVSGGLYTGNHRYEIDHFVLRMLSSGRQHDRLAWNVVQESNYGSRIVTMKVQP